MTTIRELTAWLEQIAPPQYQESYDNAGLITGDPNAPVTGVLVCLDATEEVIADAVAKGCNVVVAHHPIVFRGLKRITGRDYVERAIIKAIRHEVAIYAIHTNLDNVYHQGVNAKIAEKLGLQDTRILAPTKTMKKLSLWVSSGELLPLQGAFSALGVQHHASGGEPAYVEALYPAALQGQLLHSVQQVAPSAACSIAATEDENPAVGAGIVGRLASPVPEVEFLQMVKQVMGAGIVRHTRLLGRAIQSVALCGGAGSFLLPRAIASKADVFITADYKYHEFFDADGKIVIADIGHFESEQFTINLLHDIISEKFSTFAVRFTEVATNPVFYL